MGEISKINMGGVDYDIRDKVLEEQLGNINAKPMVSVTYSELVALRDNGELVAGMQYRITDYVTTTAQENTQSAGHQFDVIVTADNATTLNEVARACLHEGDTYFSEVSAKLEAWKIWYSLDNDVARFAWADAENGKGVIYRMIDEWNNDCPYDFKNIKFLRYELNAPDEYAAESADDKCITKLAENVRVMFEEGQRAYIWAGVSNDDRYWEDEFGVLFSSTTGAVKPFYTFSTDSDEDASLLNSCHDNKMMLSNKLPNNVFFGNYFGYNSFGNNCQSNSFGNGCQSNSFGNVCQSNSFGNDCYYNSFGNGCYSNSFGNNFGYNSFGNDCYSNSFGNGCYYNSFGNNCQSNSFGDGCQSNSFGNGCYYNSFGNYFGYNSFGNGCYSIIFEDDEGFAHNVQYVTLENGVFSIRFYYDDTSNAYSVIQNIHVYSGVNSDEVYVPADYKNTTFYAVDVQGVVHSFHILDFKNS